MLVIFFAHEMQMNGGDEVAAKIMGPLFMTIGAVGFIFGELMAGLTIYAGTQLAKQKKFMLIFVLAIIHCIFVPFGTILGVFTLVMINKDSAKQLFEQNKNQHNAMVS